MHAAAPTRPPANPSKKPQRKKRKKRDESAASDIIHKKAKTTPSRSDATQARPQQARPSYPRLSSRSKGSTAQGGGKVQLLVPLILRRTRIDHELQVGNDHLKCQCGAQILNVIVRPPEPKECVWHVQHLVRRLWELQDLRGRARS